MKQLEEFGIPYEVKVASAHRKPAEVHEWASGAEERGMRVIVAAAGKAAHLGGVVAAYTPLPVIAVPMKTKRLWAASIRFSLWSKCPLACPLHALPSMARKTLRFSRCKCSARVATNAARRFPISKRRWLNNDEEIAHGQLRPSRMPRSRRALPWSQAIRAHPRASLSKPLRSACRRVPPKTCMLNGQPMKGAALELLAGASYAGARTLFTCKQVGLNVASDPLMSLNYVGVEGGCVIWLWPTIRAPFLVADRARYASFCVVRQDSRVRSVER